MSGEITASGPESKSGNTRAGKACAIALLAAIISSTAAAQSERRMEIDIAAQDLGAALTAFGHQTKTEIAFTPEAVQLKKAPAVKGQMTPTEALQRLLAESGLIYEKTPSNVIIVKSNVPKLQLMPLQTASGAQMGSSGKDTFSGSGASANGSILGTITDARTGSGLSGALVRIVETGQQARSDGLGRFRFPSLTPGSYTIMISYLGFPPLSEPIAVRRGQRLETTYALESDAELDEIIVWGNRSARALALNQERTAENSSSVVSADLLGDFTGTTISEALRRIPGISFQRNPQTGDGVNVIVRGLEPDMNAVKLNGLHLPVGNGTGRSADLSNILADSVSQIVVNKSLLPSHDSAGTGGLIEIETKSPLSRPQRYFNLSVEGGRKDKGFGDDLLVSGTAAGTFGRRENLGLSASVQYRERDIKSVSYGINLNTGQYLPLEQDGTLSISSIAHIDPRLGFPFEPGVDAAFPNEVSSRSNESELTNLTATVSGEWQLRDHTNLRLDIQRSTDKSDSFSRSGGLNTPLFYQPLPVAALDGEVRQTLVWSGLATLNQQYQQERGRRNETTTFSLQGNTQLGKWQYDYTLGFADGSLSSPDQASTSLSLSDGTLLNDPSFLLPAATDPVEGRIISLYGRRSGRDFPLPLLTEAGWNLVNDPANYSFIDVSRINTKGENQRTTANLSATYNFDLKHVKYVEVGIDFESAEFSNTINTELFLAEPEFVFVPCCSQVFPSIDSLGLTFSDNDNFADIGYDGQGFDVVSRQDLAAFFTRLPALAEDPTVPIRRLRVSQQTGARKPLTEEDNFAAYVQTRVDIGRLEIIGGVRLSRVRVRAVNLSSPLFVDENFQNDSLFEEEFTHLVEERAVATDVLPRVLFNYRLSDNLIFRGGYFKSVARPQIMQLSSAQNIALLLPPISGPDGNQPMLQVDEGNPDLDPAVTENFDIGVEFYDGNIGVMKLGAFYKEVKNLLQTNLRVGFDSLDGVTLPDHPHFENLPDNLFIRVSRPVNNKEPADIWGIEAQLERQFTFLPGFWNGFGIFANYTYTKSSRQQNLLWTGSPIFDEAGNLIGRENLNIDFSSEPFDQQPKDSGTLAITYNKHNIDASLAHTFQARKQTFFDRNNLSAFDEKIDSLDLRVAYRFALGNGQYRIYFEGTDLLESTSDPDIERSIGGVNGTPKYYVGANFLGGRTFKLGVVANF